MKMGSICPGLPNSFGNAQPKTEGTQMKTRATNSRESRFLFVQLIVFCGLLAGCSSSPSSGDGERVIQARIKQESEGRVKLTKFEKTNGAKGELIGLTIYTLEFEAEIEFTEKCNWLTGMFGQELSFRTSKLVAAPASGFSWNKFLDDSQNPGTAVAKGQRVQLSGVVRFTKKEKGWSVDSMQLSNAKPMSGSTESMSSAASEVGNTEPNNPQNGAKRIETLREKAGKGDAEAQNELGKLYADGQGMETNAPEAVKLFQMAAAQGNAKAQANLGWSYADGRGIAKDPQEAERLFRNMDSCVSSSEVGFAEMRQQSQAARSRVSELV